MHPSEKSPEHVIVPGREGGYFCVKIYNMKLIINTLLIGMLLFSAACKKDKQEQVPDITTLASFSYSTFNVLKDAATDVEIGENFAYLTFTKQGNQTGLPHISFQIDDFKGVGEYNLSSGKITVYADEKGDEFYWKNFHNQFNEEFKGEGTIKVTRCDTQFIAELSGKLFHEEVQGSEVIFKETSFQAKTNQKIFK